MIVAFASVKGGVAKTTSCVNLAAGLAQRSYFVLVIDFDAQGGASHHMFSHFKNTKFNASLVEALQTRDPLSAIHSYSANLDLIPVSEKFFEYATYDFSKELEELLDKIQNSNKYDFIFFDLSPSCYPTSLIPLSQADTCIIPVFAKGGLSLLGLNAQVKIIAKLQKQKPKLDILGVLATFVDRTKVSQEVLKFLGTECKEERFSSYIRENTALSQAACLGKTIFEHAPNSNGAKDYAALAKEFIKRVKGRKK